MIVVFSGGSSDHSCTQSADDDVPDDALISCAFKS